MSLKLDIPRAEIQKPKITIFGVGGAGGNAINNMIRSNLEGVDFVAANTDAQSLGNSLAENKIQLGVAVTKGLGAGSFPDRGRAAAEENISEIENLLDGNNMVFIAAGMGGGTGTGAAPVIAKLARDRDILTVGVVTKPFHFEGKYRMEVADKGIEELKKHVDTLIVIPNQNLFRIANERTTFESAFKMADDVLHAGVRGITDLITMPGLVNLDFADIRTIMTKMGKAMMGTGEAEGENRAIEACEAAISNPLLDDISIKGAKGVLVNMTGGPDMTLFEADLAVNTIKKEVDGNANIIFGSAFNEDMQGKIRISVVATGIDEDEYRQESFKAQESYEPSKFRSNLEKSTSKKNTIQSSEAQKNFFDPGVAQELKNKAVEEISDSDFSSKKRYSKEENLNYGKAEKNLNSRDEDVHSMQASFFAGETVEEEFDLEEEVEEPPVFKPRKVATSNSPIVKAPHKIEKEISSASSSGFSLFGFMNSKKKPSEEFSEELIAEDKVNEDDAKRARQRHKLSEEKAQEASKKKQEFFGGTIFDKDQQEEVGLDDDVLNVPAFFRRKK